MRSRRIEVFCSAAVRRRDPGRAALPGWAAVPVQRAERIQGRFRRRLPGGRARVRGTRRAGVGAADGGCAAGRPGHPVGHGVRDPGHRGRAGLDVRGCLGALRRSGRAAYAPDPRGGAGRLPLLLRHLPRVADVRGARHESARAHGQLRGVAVRPRGRLGAHGGPALPAQRGPQLLPSAGGPGGRRHARVPRDRAADRRPVRGCGAGTPPRRATWTTSASRCTAASGASPGRIRSRRCASTLA